jgi:thiol-disulfide isomerase/thioredoxin
MKYLCLTALLCLYLSGNYAQTAPVSLGDTCPAFTLKNISNAPVFEIQSSSFSGKLVILDFWATWCAACVTDFPKMESLQQRFGDSLQIVLVNAKSKLSGETPAKIEKTLIRFRERTGSPLTLPVAYDNPFVDSLFPYSTIPHEVWIYKGRVMAITSALEVNEPNIAAVLRGDSYHMRTKTDQLALTAAARVTAPLPDNLRYRSTLTGFQEGYYGVGTYPDSGNAGLIKGLYYYNNTLEELLRDACIHNQLFDLPPNRTVLSLAGPEPFLVHTDTSVYRYQYCYELRLPATDFPSAREWMFRDLCRYFSLKVDTPSRMLPCLVVRATPKLTRSRSHGGERTLDIDQGTVRKFLRNYSVPQALSLLDRFCRIPVLDETGSLLQIDLDLPADLSDPDALSKALQKAGFDVSVQERLLKVTLIADR